MAQPLYFLPGITRATLAPGGKLVRSILRARGLADVFDDVGVGREDFGTNDLAGRGPGNKSGLILFYQRSDGAIPRRAGYYPAEQEWTEVNDGLWIGVDTDDPPTAADLARKKQYGGYTLELANGERWLVPVIRRPDGTTELPTDMLWNEAGLLVEPLKDRYRSYWDESAEVCSWFFDNQDGFDKAKALTLAVRALGLNYRYGRAEQNIIRAVDTETFMTVLAATVDLPKVNEMSDAEKKSASLPDTPSVTPGCAEPTPDTGLAAVI